MAKFLKFFLIACFMLSTTPTLAAGKVETKSNPVNSEKEDRLESQLSYPELEVTPRASDRLDIEYKNENKSAWLTHLPIQFSALTTLLAGTSSESAPGATAKEKSDYESAQTIATGVGAGWLVLTGVLSATYRPYRSGRVETSKLPKGTDREQLTRERIAEEALYEPAALATRLKWFSVATNLYASSALLAGSHTDSRMNIYIAIASSFAPLIFESRWTKVANTHRDYKKKIYGPLAVSTLFPAGENRLAPGIALHWSF